MPVLALFANLTFYHLSLLAFLLGAQIYQSFFANIAASTALSRSQFRILQASIWPMYFELQMVASLLLALTYPGGGIGGGTGALFRGAASARGVLETEDRWAVLLPLGTMLVLSTANEMVVVPKTISLMWKLHVETVREEKARGITASQSQEDQKVNFLSARDRETIMNDTKSPELKALTYKFLAFHLGSYVCNLVTVGATVCYAVCIAARGL